MLKYISDEINFGSLVNFANQQQVYLRSQIHKKTLIANVSPNSDSMRQSAIWVA